MVDTYQKIYTIKFDKFLEAHLRNQRHIAKVNHEAFRAYFSYINTAYIVIEKVEKEIKNSTLNQTESIAIGLYAHLLRMADQIGIMLLNGYGDGSLILWRAFYEHALTLTLLMNNNDDSLTEKFLQHRIRSLKRKADSYNKHREDLKFPPLEQQIIDDIANRQQLLKDRNGKEFIENDYGWADGLFSGKQKATLRGIEDLIEWGRYRVFYIWASEYAHSGFEPLAVHTESGMIILPRVTRQSDELQGMIDPMQLTLGIFHEVNTLFLLLVSVEHEYDLNLLMFRKLYDNMQSIFADFKQEKQK